MDAAKYDKAEARALRLAQQTGETMHVTIGDFHGDGTEVFAVLAAHDLDDEFEAFGGRVLAEVHPSGGIER